MGDDEDDGNLDLLKRVVRDPDGNRRTDRVLDAVRGRRSAHSDLLPRLGLALLAALIVSPVLGFLDYGTMAGAVETLGWGLVAYLFLAVLWVTDRIEDYYEGDADIAVEELRARYARGEMDLETFQRRVDRVYEEGPEWVFEDGDGDAVAGDDDGAFGFGVVDEGSEEHVPATRRDDEDPMDILQRRLARGEISEEEYRSRVAAIQETTDDADGSEAGTATVDGEREQEREQQH
jgi:uncharacterized membrane protein